MVFYPHHMFVLSYVFFCYILLFDHGLWHSDGYMEALGATQAAKVKREAQEGTSLHVNAGREEVAKAKVD